MLVIKVKTKGCTMKISCLTLIPMLLNTLSLYALQLNTSMDSTAFMGPFSNNDTLTQRYTKTFDFNFNIADSTGMDYLDIQEGFIYYTFSNHTSYDLVLDIIHNDIWSKNYCTNKGFDSRSALTSSDQDSVEHFYGDIIAAYVVPPESLGIAKGNFSGSRMFLTWDNNRASTSITFTIKLFSQGDSVRIANTDSIKMGLSLNSFTAVDSKNRTWSANTLIMDSSPKRSEKRNGKGNRYSVYIPFKDNHQSSTNIRVFYLNGKSIDYVPFHSNNLYLVQPFERSAQR